MLTVNSPGGVGDAYAPLAVHRAGHHGALVVVVALGLTWWPLLPFLSFAVLVFQGAKRWDGLLVAIPLAAWYVHLVVILPMVRETHGCTGWGLWCNSASIVALVMLVCEAAAMRECFRGPSLTLLIALALNWSWILLFRSL